MLKNDVHRVKLPKFARWPVSLSILNHFFADIECLQGANVHYNSAYRINKFVKPPLESFDVIGIQFRSSRWGEGWSIQVSPIPANLTGEIKRVLIEKKLPELADWAKSMKTPDPKATRRYISKTIKYQMTTGLVFRDD